KVRVEAANALRRIGPPAAGVLPQLLAALKDPNPAVQRVVIQALGGIGPAAAKETLPGLLAAPRDPDPEKAPPAPAGLGLVGVAEPAVVALLEEVLNGKDVVAAGSASLALSYLDPGSAAARAAQARALRHPYEFVAADALEVVRRWPEAGPVPEGTT